jgi:predicted ferric reductase
MKLSNSIDKFGIAGLFLTAFLSPCCFPLFAVLASAIGLGSFELFGGWTMWIFQAMVFVSVIGLYISYRKHRCTYPLLVAIPSGLLIFYGYHFNNSEALDLFFVCRYDWTFRSNNLELQTKQTSRNLRYLQSY